MAESMDDVAVCDAATELLKRSNPSGAAHIDWISARWRVFAECCERLGQYPDDAIIDFGGWLLDELAKIRTETMKRKPRPSDGRVVIKEADWSPDNHGRWYHLTILNDDGSVALFVDSGRALQCYRNKARWIRKAMDQAAYAWEKREKTK